MNKKTKKEQLVQELVENYSHYLVKFSMETTPEKLMFMDENLLQDKLWDFRTFERNTIALNGVI